METLEKLPKSLLIVIFSIVIIAIVSLIKPFPSLDTFALLATLIVLIVYTYYTYQVAKSTYKAAIEPQIPVASFLMELDPLNPNHVFFKINNHSKVPIDCWCKLNPTVDEKVIQLNNFYGGKSPFKIQPYGSAQGHFYVSEIVEKSEYKFEFLEELPETSKTEKIVYFKVDFYYNKIGSSEQFHNPIQPCFYSFASHQIILDF